MRESSGSNTEPVPATRTGNSSFMYMTWSSVRVAGTGAVFDADDARKKS